jgi:hypothetical protein
MVRGGAGSWAAVRRRRSVALEVNKTRAAGRQIIDGPMKRKKRMRKRKKGKKKENEGRMKGQWTSSRFTG